MPAAAICANCGAAVDTGRHFCQRCGHPTTGPRPDQPVAGPMQAPGAEYPAMRTGAVVLKIVGWIIAASGGVTAVTLIVLGAVRGDGTLLTVGVGTLFGAFIQALGFLIGADFLRVVLDIERNTRRP